MHADDVSNVVCSKFGQWNSIFVKQSSFSRMNSLVSFLTNLRRDHWSVTKCFCETKSTTHWSIAEGISPYKTFFKLPRWKCYRTIDSCVAVLHREMKHLGSLESTQEARAARGSTSSNSYASFVVFKLPACFNSRWSTLTHETIVNCHHFKPSSRNLDYGLRKQTRYHWYLTFKRYFSAFPMIIVL